MTHWYYFTQTGEKVGPITTSELKKFVRQGIIKSDTVIKDNAGHTVIAGKVTGLIFPESVVTPPVTNEVYGMATSELPKPPTVPSPFTTVLPDEDNPFVVAPPPKKKSVVKEQDKQLFVYKAERWIRVHSSLTERIIERIVILLVTLLVCFRVFPAFVLLWLLVIWFGIDLVRQVKKVNDDS